MYCGKCGMENQDGAKFCKGCGVKLGRAEQVLADDDAQTSFLEQGEGYVNYQAAELQGELPQEQSVWQGQNTPQEQDVWQGQSAQQEQGMQQNQGKTRNKDRIFRMVMNQSGCGDILVIHCFLASRL